MIAAATTTTKMSGAEGVYAGARASVRQLAQNFNIFLNSFVTPAPLPLLRKVIHSWGGGIKSVFFFFLSGVTDLERIIPLPPPHMNTTQPTHRLYLRVTFFNSAAAGERLLRAFYMLRWEMEELLQTQVLVYYRRKSGGRGFLRSRCEP